MLASYDGSLVNFSRRGMEAAGETVWLQTLTHFYESGTIQQLREIAKYLEVKGISRLSKKPLVALLIDKSPSHIEEWRRFLRLPCLAGGMLKNYISVWVAGCFHFTMFKCIQPA